MTARTVHRIRVELDLKVPTTDQVRRQQVAEAVYAALCQGLGLEFEAEALHRAFVTELKLRRLDVDGADYRPGLL